MWPDPLLLLASAAPEAGASPHTDFLTLLFVLMLASFIGLEVIRNVSRLLHTPLMSLTNAISAIAVVGSILLAGKAASKGHEQSMVITIMGAVALAASMTNIVSGFLLTDRMLKMFKKREPGK
jgi:H+-translocating NAD(P) transhydrogenase subunit alpha